jgi:hypothetical protein
MDSEHERNFSAAHRREVSVERKNACPSIWDRIRNFHFLSVAPISSLTLFNEYLMVAEDGILGRYFHKG